ncbi:MAG: archaeosortase/exosortase family protein [Vicingaceae bacterium]
MKQLALQYQFLYRVILLIIVWVILVTDVQGFYTHANVVLMDSLQNYSLSFIELLGYQVFSEGRLFGIVGSTGVILGAPCDGLSLMYLYAGFIIALPGKWQRKLIWSLSGVITIHILNLIRVILLVAITMEHRDWLAFNHDYSFTLGMYLIILISWVVYVRKI